MKIVGFLQNAWSPLYAGDTWPRESWLRALHACRSGQKLRFLKSFDIWYDNTTPIVGGSPDSVVPPDYNHIVKVLDKVQPTAVIAFGKQAENCLDRFYKDERSSWHFFVVPHPAARVTSNMVYQQLALELHRVLGYTELKKSKKRIKPVKGDNTATEITYL